MHIWTLQKTVIRQHDNARIRLAANQPASGLEYLTHSRIDIGIIKAIFSSGIKILTQQIAFKTKLWQANANNHNPIEAIPWQIHTF
ncbi:hypothetical protein D3C76_1359630 [compost metagenome]